MIENIWVTSPNPSASILQLNLTSSGDTHGLVIFNFEGLGPPKGTISGTSSPTMAGVQNPVTTIDARHMVLTLAVKPGADEEAAKQKVYDYFPIGQTIQLRIATEQKDVIINAIVESNEFNQFAKIENAVISLYSASPYFKGYTEVDETATNPDTLVYDGEVETGVRIDVGFTGFPGTSITLNNVNSWDNHEMLISFQPWYDYSSTWPQNGDTLRIYTWDYAKKIIFIRSGAEFNLINGLDLDSEFITFRPGNNIVSLTCTNEEYAEADYIYRPLYEGV